MSLRQKSFKMTGKQFPRDALSQSRNSIRTLRFLSLLLVTSACAQIPEGKTVAPLDLSYEDKVYYLLFDAALRSEIEYGRARPDYQAFARPFCLWIDDDQNRIPSPALKDKIKTLVLNYPRLKLASQIECEKDKSLISNPDHPPLSARHIFVGSCKREECREIAEEKNVDVGEYGGFYDGTGVVIMKSGNKIWLGSIISRWVA